MTDATGDLNNVIMSAVNARIETAVLEALSGDQFVGQMVATTLQKKVVVEDRRSYQKRETTFLALTLESTIQGAVQEATKRLVAEQAEEIEEAVRKELKRSSAEIAKQLVGSMTEAAERAYGITVDLKFPGRS